MSLDGLEQVDDRSAELPPGRSETRVWAYGLDLDPPIVTGLQPLLSADEIDRLERLRNSRDRARFTVGRAQLRLILGDYLGVPPGSLEFAITAAGKPFLAAGDSNERPFHFNASGSGSLGVVALRTDAEVGVDIEEIRPLPDMAALARGLLGVEEYREFAALPEPRRQSRLFDYWVRKEAAAKALGAGLRQEMNRLAFHPWHGEGVHRVEAGTAGLRDDVWIMRLPVPLAGYAAALASTQPFGPVLSAWREPPPGPG